VARHGSEIDHVLGEGPTAFRFSRMGRDGEGHQLDDRTIELLAANMTPGGGSGVETSGVPAGYTYLGQFIAHDLSFDKTIVTLGANVSPSGLLQARSPSLDLDSLYGAGPQDPESAGFFETNGTHLKTGRTVEGGGHGEEAGFDLPRGGGSNAAERRKAVIADERNDDNLAVAQTHLAFMRFHNRVVDTLPASVPAALRVTRARELVTKHYQWLIRSDYLPRICAKAVLDDVFTNGRKAFEAAAEPTDLPTMPVEFSVAAFRLGHSMVRDVYKWNRLRETVRIGQLFRFSAKSGDLGGKDRLPSDMIADFRRLYDLGGVEPNFAMRIDTRLIGHLGQLPPGSFGEQDAPREKAQSNLAFRNLTRARMVRLASGHQMAEFLTRDCGVKLDELTRRQILEGDNGAALDGFGGERKEALVERTPLWFYILREAECNGGKLNGVGARIVAETFHRAIEASGTSILRDPDWRPTLGRDGARFGMADLLRFASAGNPHVIAPLEQDPPPA
jgi:hypothetical protein